MTDPEIRAALERHWAASAAGNQDAEHEIYVMIDSPLLALQVCTTDGYAMSDNPSGKETGAIS